MGESLTQQHRVRDDTSWSVNLCQWGRNLTVPTKEASANYVPAAAVIRRMQALSGIIGRKANVGGYLSLGLKTKAQPWECPEYWVAGGRQRKVEFQV